MCGILHRSDTGADKHLKLIYDLLLKIMLHIVQQDTQNKYCISSVELIIQMINNNRLSSEELSAKLVDNLSKWIKTTKKQQTSGCTEFLERLVEDANKGDKSWQSKKGVFVKNKKQNSPKSCF